MKTTMRLTSLAVVLAATPLAAQITPRGGGTSGGTARERVQTPQDVIEAARQRAGVLIGTRGGTVDSRDSRTSGNSRIPKGHLPPRGMCRVWVDGVPPGHQPPVTSCAQAEADRYRYGANARVIYGDQESFPGKGKGKFKNADGRYDGRTAQRECSVWDRVVVNGRVENVCRDGSVYGSQTSNRVYDQRVYDDDDSDAKGRGKAKANAAKQRGKSGKKGGRG